MTKISIVIPVLNEAKIIEKTLENLKNSSGDIEIIVVDGGSTDETVNLVGQKQIKIVVSPYPGRAHQMNLGAKIARGDVLLFLHADTRLPQGYSNLVRQCLSSPQTIAGAFPLALDGGGKLLRLIEIGVNFRSRFCSLPYGDQAIFLPAQVFREMGGYADLPIMEDFELVRRLRKKGKISLVSTPVVTSARRWQSLGVVRTTLINQLIILGYFFGIPPQTLARWYGRK